MPFIRTDKGSTELGTQFDVRRAVVTPGQYLATVIKCEESTYSGKKDPNATYLKMRPTVVLFNEQQTIIEMDVPVGQIDESGAVFQPDPKKAAEGVSGVWTDALFFMTALGFERVEDFASELVTGQVCVVSVMTESYTNRDGRPGQKNIIGWKRQNGKIGCGFFKLNPTQEQNAAWIEQYGLWEELGMWWAKDAHVEAYVAALDALENGTSGNSDDDVI